MPGYYHKLLDSRLSRQSLTLARDKANQNTCARLKGFATSLEHQKVENIDVNWYKTFPIYCVAEE